MLALIAGRGALPGAVAAAQSRLPLVCALAGFEPDGLAVDVSFRLEGLGPLLSDLWARGVREVCLCGAIERPAIDPALIAPETRPLIPILQQAIAAGDDGALRAVMSIFESHGFGLRAAHDLAPDLLVGRGVLTQSGPDAAMQEAAARGDAVLAALAPLDVGQACVVGAGQVWGVETVGGTGHMLGALPSGVRQARAVLVKGAKGGQDLRADMPTIGPETIEQVLSAGAVGIALEAGRVLMLDRGPALARANAAGLVIWARGRD